MKLDVISGQHLSLCNDLNAEHKDFQIQEL